MLTDARNPEHWFDFAERDLARACRRFAEGDYEDCLFRLQQCAEKVLKGKLIALGWKLQKVHDLGSLIVALGSYGIDCSWFEPAADVLATDYIADRYPGFDDTPPDAIELRGFVTDTTSLFERLSGRRHTGPRLAS